MLAWLLLFIVLAGVAGIALWWLLIKTEGVYLGRGVVIWLYDVYARRYDGIKQFEAYGEDLYLARPILKRLLPVTAPLVLDVATGTGRLPLALLEQSTFQGRVIGVDLSRRMLTVAAEKLAPHGNRVTLMHGPAETLPFPDNTFDLVTCLEALEFMMHPREVLRELARVLRPGGLLVLTNRQGRDAKLMPGKTFSHTELEHFLREDVGLSHVYIQPWQVDYRLVWGKKPGYSLPTGPRLLEEIWRCPHCGAVAMEHEDSGWRCGECHRHSPRAADGVIDLTRARS